MSDSQDIVSGASMSAMLRGSGKTAMHLAETWSEWRQSVNISEFRITLEKETDDGKGLRRLLRFTEHDFCDCHASMLIFRAAHGMNRFLIEEAIREAWGNGP